MQFSPFGTDKNCKCLECNAHPAHLTDWQSTCIINQTSGKVVLGARRDRLGGQSLQASGIWERESYTTTFTTILLQINERITQYSRARKKPPVTDSSDTLLSETGVALSPCGLCWPSTRANTKLTMRKSEDPSWSPMHVCSSEPRMTAKMPEMDLLYHSLGQIWAGEPVMLAVLGCYPSQLSTR
ncbi:uncharacterized protein UV8b_03115 [Ustilaginoidea virens]|uniref:Uncharacterized protein n=1 Tax=Ustilaginoidea virens TaxID=1159556 RepID=A0A8E5HNQ2_USTVR|nr:uncharacterized protein UV8b_03115 [Ustilaginoidea virens]QUC18874.1 hypothetical protein UV8b_03115 [Ustilaginoidea virens]